MNERNSMMAHLRLPSWVDPNRHFWASNLFPRLPFNQSERYLASYGQKAHTLFAEQFNGGTPRPNKVWKVDELNITVGYRVDAIKDGVVYELKEYRYFFRYRYASIIQANLYKVAEGLDECKLATYRIKDVTKPPRFSVRTDTKQLTREEMVKGLDTFVAPHLRKMQKIAAYA